MKKKHVEIPGSSKKEVKVPAVIKDSCEISMCLGLWMVLKFPRGVAKFCGISTKFKVKLCFLRNF